MYCSIFECKVHDRYLLRRNLDISLYNQLRKVDTAINCNKEVEINEVQGFFLGTKIEHMVRLEENRIEWRLIYSGQYNNNNNNNSNNNNHNNNNNFLK